MRRCSCVGRAARSRLEPRNLALERHELLEARAARTTSGRLGGDGRGRGCGRRRGGQRAAGALIAQPSELFGQPASHRASHRALHRACARGAQYTVHCAMHASRLRRRPALLVSSMPAPLSLRGLQLELESPAQLCSLLERLLVSPLRRGRPLGRRTLCRSRRGRNTCALLRLCRRPLRVGSLPLHLAHRLVETLRRGGDASVSARAKGRARVRERARARGG